VSTGRFDPAGALEDWAEETAAAHIGDRPDALTHTDHSTAEEARAFREQIARREAELQEVSRVVRGDVATPRERQFGRDLTRLFRQAQWLYQTGHFPNGEPLLRQGPLQVAVWEVFLSAIVERSNGGGNESGAEDALEHL